MTNPTMATNTPSGGRLLCHCDHCPNNTCTAEDQGVCYGKLTLDTYGEIRKELNCFHKDDRLVQNIMCNDTSTLLNKTEQIMRCCRSRNHCNQMDDFLPAFDEAKKFLVPTSPRSLSNPPPPIPDPDAIGPFNKYPIPLELRFVIIISAGLFIIFVIAITQNWLTERRKKGFLRQHVGEEDHHSENSSNKANSAVFDTNSMASREPLINNISCNTNQSGSNNNPINLMFQTNSLNHPQPQRGPWMAEESCNGKSQSTFQMSIGSGQPQSKRETSSGSGAGQPYLTQRSIAHDIQLKEIVGRGYFGVVWRGEYKGGPVAVKIFSAMAEPSWEREAEIYQTTLLRHKNILGFTATDRRDDLSTTGYWLVTDYYPMGSLYDFLKSHSVLLPDSIRMAFSIANGLSHLHVEIFGTQGKPAIAHRDIKSKNILVKNDGTCCIADLGMAIRYNSNTGIVDVPTNSRVGTRRYLAPEILENKLNLMDFEAVKATDVYALGLVFWELLRRTENEGLVDGYEAPYQQFVSLDPTTEEMCDVVCVQKIRPPLSPRWDRVAPMREYSGITRECWYEKPPARLSALRVRKTLSDIAKHYFNLDMEYD